MACKICLDTMMTLNRETGVMECSNGHVNYIGSPDKYSPEDSMDNALFDNIYGPKGI